MNSQATSRARRKRETTTAESYAVVRAASEALCASLEIEDYVAQSMPDASPVKWHLAHTSWFFETFVLQPHQPGYRPYREEFGALFNSYYQGAGPALRRAERGLCSRPTVREIFAYRHAVDDAVQRLLAQNLPEVLAVLIRLGLEHEQQHQELILTDLKHLFSCNPALPAYLRGGVLDAREAGPLEAMRYRRYVGGVLEIGAGGEGFCFDNELPRHRVFLAPYQLGMRLVTNAEFREFIRDGGYRQATLWLSDGWASVESLGWSRPLYWREDLESEFTLRGVRTLSAHAPVAHISYYEADAFARWAGARLPTEAEWESAAASQPVAGNFVESRQFRPLAAPAADHTLPQQLYGDVWEWTQSAYAPYPGFHPLAGALGEYNGKFMANQFVLRGGSCASPAPHLRATYRNFFYPHARWQFSGLRLARDA